MNDEHTLSIYLETAVGRLRENRKCLVVFHGKTCAGRDLFRGLEFVTDKYGNDALSVGAL